MDSNLKGRLFYGKCELKVSYCLKKMKVDHFISERIYKLNALEFWIKLWCLSRLAAMNRMCMTSKTPHVTHQVYVSS